MDNPPKTRILILGAGFAGTYTFIYLKKYFHKNPEIELCLADKNDYFLFTPLLHEVATGGQTAANIAEPFRQIMPGLKNFRQAEIKKINLRKSFVETSGGQINYDYLVMALGSTTNFFNTPGATENCLTLKSLPDAIAIKNRLKKSTSNFVVIGGGATGVELAGELADFRGVKITLIQAARELLPQFSAPIRGLALRALQKKGVIVRLNAKVIRVGKNNVELEGNETLATDTTIWVGGITPVNVNIKPLPLKEPNGRFVVNEFWQLPNYQNVFALGDMAARAPALAQAATKAAKTVAFNIFRLINNKPLKAYAYRSSGELVSLGRWNAAGKIMGITFSGKFAWWLWRTVYLFKMPTWQKKIKVALDWTIDLFSSQPPRF